MLCRTNLRSATNLELYVPMAHLKSIHISGPTIWNNLQLDVRTAKSVCNFKQLYQGTNQSVNWSYVWQHFVNMVLSVAYCIYLCLYNCCILQCMYPCQASLYCIYVSPQGTMVDEHHMAQWLHLYMYACIRYPCAVPQRYILTNTV